MTCGASLPGIGRIRPCIIPTETNTASYSEFALAYPLVSTFLAGPGAIQQDALAVGDAQALHRGGAERGDANAAQMPSELKEFAAATLPALKEHMEMAHELHANEGA